MERHGGLMALVITTCAFVAGDSVVRGRTQAGTADTPALDRLLSPRVERVYTALARTFAAGRAMTTVRTMSGGGWRLAGNPAYEAAQDLIADGLAEAGFRPRTSSGREATSGQVRRDREFWYEEYSLPTPGWEPVSARLALGGVSGTSGILIDTARGLDRVSLCINSFSTPEAGVSAPLVFVGRGASAADYQQAGDVRGKIVLGEADASRLFEQAVRQRGALGVLSSAAEPYTRPQETPDLVQWGGIRYDEQARGFGFKISARLAGFLKERLSAGPVTLNARVVARFHARPNRTLVAEIAGTAPSAQRVVLVAHVQEPGANDNASGCATLLEIARTLANAIAGGTIPRPARTMTFLWGDEIAQSRQWLRADKARAASVRYAFSLDMTGEDVTKTGGSFLIEKEPDPSAVWTRPSDPHSEWGSSAVSAESLKGSLLNDLHLAVCLRRARDTGWVIKANPYEGGSDHSVFLAARVPALLDWHFTDRYYHTNLDTLDKTSAAEMANVGVAVGTTVWWLASANQQDALAAVRVIEEAAQARLKLEERQAAEAMAAAADAAAARVREDAVRAAWKKWYVEAIESVRGLSVGAPGAALETRVSRAVAAIRR